MQGVSEPGIPLSVSLSGVTSPGGTRDARELLAWVKGLGVRWVQLDATMQGTRPRDLDRSARRDLASVIRRSELGLSGLDLFIPPRHLVEKENVDRAVTATTGAIELAGELRLLIGTEPPPVAMELPADLPSDVRAQIESTAARVGVMVADHTRPAPALRSDSSIGVGIDPAAMLAGGEDVFDALTKLRGAPLEARLSDTSGGARVVAGSPNGKLDLVEYAAALGVAGYRRPLVIDLRGIPSARSAAPRVIASWRRGEGISGTA